jgi:SIR2-like domain
MHVAVFLELAEDVIRKEVDFLSIDTDLSVHDAFLRRIARRSSRRARVKLFTTNYDRCFEQAAQSSGFVVVDGFAFGSEAVFDSAEFNYDVARRSAGEEKSEFIENLFHLYKLRGSIDWELDVAFTLDRRDVVQSCLPQHASATKFHTEL